MYKTEDLLTEHVMKELNCGSLFSASRNLETRTVILNEVSLGYGVADIVVAETSTAHEVNPRELTSADLFVYDCVANCPGQDFVGLASSTKIQSKTLKQALTRLEACCYVEAWDDKFYNAKEYEFCYSESVAIEVKLTNWRRALRQAHRYKWFSERSFVCIPEDNASQAVKHLDTFRQLSVGLMTLTQSGTLSIIFEPDAEKPINTVMKMMLNEELLTRLGDA